MNLEKPLLIERAPLYLVKRAIDVFVSATSLLFLSPLLAVTAAVIKIDSSGPVLYRWRVIGRGGIPFTGYKFRTMVENAEQMEKNLRAEGQNEMDGIYFKIGNDPRVTRVGKFLRKYSLDELPTLYSVLKGDMSLVGPRPARVHEFEQFECWHKARLAVKPGLTGLWQVSGKNKITKFDDIVRMDLQYIENWSLRLDLEIIFRTIPVVLLGHNY